jgi:hypothetical protein
MSILGTTSFLDQKQHVIVGDSLVLLYNAA